MSDYSSKSGASTASSIAKLVVIVLVVILACVGTGLYGCPSYNVYTSKMEGQAELAKAEASKQVAVQTAKAKMESADYEAKAEVRRAEGAAAAIKVTGAALQANPEYLRYLYVNNLANSHDQIIYIPTEAGIPILEAGRRPTPQAPVEDPKAKK